MPPEDRDPNLPPLDKVVAWLREFVEPRHGRVELTEIHRAFDDAFRAWRSPVKVSVLRKAMDVLEKEGLVGFPPRRDASCWETRTLGTPPTYLRRIRRTPREERPRDTVWHPRLTNAANSARGRGLERLLLLNAFLQKESRQGKTQDAVPFRERSLEIFGDEKTLENIIGRRVEADGSSEIVVAGSATLRDVGCVAPAMPLGWLGADGETATRDILVVENHHTWASLAGWNERERAFAAVALGSGDVVRGAGHFLAKLASRFGGGCVYFGDIDANGLYIPARFNASASRDVPRLRPALFLYDLLLKVGRPAPAPPTTIEIEGLDFLPGEPGRRSREIISAGARVAQEWVGTKVLSDLSAGDVLGGDVGEEEVQGRAGTLKSGVT